MPDLDPSYSEPHECQFCRHAKDDGEWEFVKTLRCTPTKPKGLHMNTNGAIEKCKKVNPRGSCKKWKGRNERFTRQFLLRTRDI